VPASVPNVVSRTSVFSTYRRVLRHSPTGWTCQYPASLPSSRAKIGGESNRGKASHSTEPARSTRPVECRSPMRAWSPMGVFDM